MFGVGRVTRGALLSLTAGFVLAQGAHAQSALNMYAAAGVPFNVKVRSMHDLTYEHIVAQRYDFSCGSAALATLLKYGYGINIPETEMIRRMMVYSTPAVVVKNGFSMLDMKKFVETLGLRGRGFRVTSEALYHLRIPVLVLMNSNGYEHFVLVKHAEDGRIFIADPALGNRIVSEKDFDKKWNGLVFAVVGKPFREDSPLLQGNESLALKLRERALENSTATTPFVEYGLIKAELF
jgi:predicted double-glycine peptidase